MADDDSWKNSFRSWSDPARFAHPDSPAGGSGPGASRRLVPLGTGDDWPSVSPVPHPDSPAGRLFAWSTNRYLASSTNLNLSLNPATIWRIIDATSWEALKSLTQMLDEGSFELGFFYGVAEGGWGVIEGLLDFGRMILLEGIYEKIHSQSWWWHPEDKVLDLLLHSQLETAHREFQQLLDELREVVSHPLVFFGNLWDAEVEEYSQKWQRFKELMKKPSIRNSFAAGRIAGQTALEVVLLLATVIDGAGLALKGAKALGDLPELLGTLAKRVSGKDAEAMLKRLRRGHGTIGEPKAPKLERPTTEPSPLPKGDDLPPRLPEMPEERVPCFKASKLPKSKLAEMDQQLAGQQKGLNEMTVQQYQDGRAAFDKDGRGDPAVARRARADYEIKLTDELIEQFQDDGYAPDVAKELARQEAARQMSTLAALHNPDQVAGGANVITGFGDRQVNSTIGGQWASNVPEVGKSRVALLDEAASAVPAAARATTMMNVGLGRCK